jgi:hypothetical protein
MDGAADQMAGPTSIPCRKSFAFGAVLCTLAFIPAVEGRSAGPGH